MIYVGNHISVSGGYPAMAVHETALGGDTFAFFPRNPRGGKAAEVAPGDLPELQRRLAEGGFGPLVVHGAYTMNVCAAREDVRRFSREMLGDDLARLQGLPGHFYNFHPGCHVGQGTAAGVELVAEALASAVRHAEETSGLPLQTCVLLETMAGKGSEIGGDFTELRAILDRAAELGGDALVAKLGVCFDTCHVWDGGCDLRGDLEGVLRRFDDAIGLDRLRAVHLNDSKNDCGSHKDRHEKLGQGRIGEDALRAVVRHPAFQDKPFIIETPNDDPGYRAEIALVRSWIA